VSALAIARWAALVGHDFRLAAGGLVHGRAARRVPLSGDDECPFAGPPSCVRPADAPQAPLPSNTAGDRIYDELRR